MPVRHAHCSPCGLQVDHACPATSHYRSQADDVKMPCGECVGYTMIILRLLVACSLLLSSYVGCVAQNPDSRAEHISVAIDLLGLVRKGVSQRFKGQEFKAYKAVSLRFSDCSNIYKELPKDPGLLTGLVLGVDTRKAPDVLESAASFLYPDKPENFGPDLSRSVDRFMKMIREKDDRRLNHLIRNCRDFMSGQAATVENAVVEAVLD